MFRRPVGSRRCRARPSPECSPPECRRSVRRRNVHRLLGRALFRDGDLDGELVIGESLPIGVVVPVVHQHVRAIVVFVDKSSLTGGVVAGDRDVPRLFELLKAPLRDTITNTWCNVCASFYVGTPYWGVVVHPGDLQVVHAAFGRGVAGGPQQAPVVFGDVQARPTPLPGY